jgi:TRAP-type mannitol/chloroaromatic compound transport system substrate-binding protein
MTSRGLSNRAALFAVVVAFGAGLLGSLAVRPHAITGERGSNATESDGQQNARITWRVPVVFQTNLPVLGDNPIYVAKQVEAASAGAIRFRLYEPGEVVPAFSVTDAVRDNKVEAGYTWLGYDQGKIPASALLGAVPFSMEPWEYSAWWYEAGGRELGEALYAPHNMHLLYCGMTGPETAGWFRKRIDTLEDMKGLKIRFAGIGGKVIEQLGASVTMLPGGEIFQALEKGAIDASEFALPVVDQTLGFDRIAKFNYYPGWHQPFTASHLVINKRHWEAISDSDKALIETACTAGVTRNLARSEGLQGAVMAAFPEKGVSAEVLPMEILRELEAVSERVLEAEADADADFAKILESQRKFRAEYANWKSKAYLPRDF